jgi:hypothetical protein
MASWFRLAGASAVLAGVLLGVLASCGSPPYTTADEEQVGKVGQPCFPGDTCDPGLTCVAEAIPTDAASLGTDGGQCWDLDEAAAPDAASDASDAPDEDAAEKS